MKPNCSKSEPRGGFMNSTNTKWDPINKKLITSLLLSVTLSFSSFAYDERELPTNGGFSQANYSEQNSADYSTYEVGYQIPLKLFEENYFLYNQTKNLFLPAKNLNPYSIKYPQPLLYSSVTNYLANYIKSEKNGGLKFCQNGNCLDYFSEINGVSEEKMAEEIVNSSYCFGTDPFVVASKIRQESKFDLRAISRTGAVGLTQMTEIGLKEILDQLGHRGEKYAEEDIYIFIAKAIDCYAKDSVQELLQGFPQINTFFKSKVKTEYVASSIDAFKKWFSYNSKYSPRQKKILIKRQLILGQLLLKIYLTYSYEALKNKSMHSVYDNALRMFNGDKIKIRYAKEVLKKSNPRF